MDGGKNVASSEFANILHEDSSTRKVPCVRRRRDWRLFHGRGNIEAGRSESKRQASRAGKQVDRDWSVGTTRRMDRPVLRFEATFHS